MSEIKESIKNKFVCVSKQNCKSLVGRWEYQIMHINTIFPPKKTFCFMLQKSKETKNVK